MDEQTVRDIAKHEATSASLASASLATAVLLIIIFVGMIILSVEKKAIAPIRSLEQRIQQLEAVRK